MRLRFEDRSNGVDVYGGVRSRECAVYPTCARGPGQVGRRNLLGSIRRKRPGGDWYTDRRLSEEVGVVLCEESEEAMRAALVAHFAD